MKKTKRIKNLVFKGVALVLFAAFALACVPESLRCALADGISEIKANSAVAEQPVPEQPEPVLETAAALQPQEKYKLSEMENMRTATRKVFGMSDGTVLVEIYSAPVHYFDETEGKFEEFNEAQKNSMRAAENTAVSDKKAVSTVFKFEGITMPACYFLTDAKLSYSYEAESAETPIKVELKDGGVLTEKAAVSASKQTAGKIKAVTEIAADDLKGDSAEFEITADGANGAQVYSDDAKLELTYAVNVGLNPEAVTERFDLDGIENHVNAMTGKLTSVVDCLSINSGDMPLNLQLVYNTDYDKYHQELKDLTRDTTFSRSCDVGKNFILNFEQHAVYENEGSYYYIDGTGAVHHFNKYAERNGFDKLTHLECNDCDLIYGGGYIYKNGMKYLNFRGSNLRQVYGYRYYLDIIYTDVIANGKEYERIIKIDIKSNEDKKTVHTITPEYDGNARLVSLKSDCGGCAEFKYDSKGNLTEVRRNDNNIAKFTYNSDNTLSSVTDRMGTGYSFTYSDTKINAVHCLNRNNPVSTDITCAYFSQASGYSTVEFTTAGQKNYNTQYLFDTAGYCISALSSYGSELNADTPRKNFRLYNKSRFTNKLNTYLNYELGEIQNNIINGDFENTTSDGAVAGWTLSSGLGGSVSGNGGRALFLLFNQTATGKLNLNYEDTGGLNYYLFCYYAKGSGDLNVSVPDLGISQTNTLEGEGKYYYQLISEDKLKTVNQGKIIFKGAYALIDNVFIEKFDYAYAMELTRSTAEKTEYFYTEDNYDTIKTNGYGLVTEQISSGNKNGQIKKATYTYNEKNYPTQISYNFDSGNDNFSKADTADIYYTYTDNKITKAESVYYDAGGNSQKTVTEAEYDANGFISKQITADGDKLYYSYVLEKGYIRSVKVTHCAESKNVAAGSSHALHADDYTETYTYDEYGVMTGADNGLFQNTVSESADNAVITSSGFSANIAKNGYGNPVSVNVNSSALPQVEYEYDSKGYPKKKTYNHSASKKDTIEYTYDNYGQLSQEKRKYDFITKTISYSPDYQNKTFTVNDDGTEYVYKEYFDTPNFVNPTKYRHASVSINGLRHKAEYIYMEIPEERYYSSVYNMNGREYVAHCNLDKNGRVTIEYNEDYSANYVYDAMGRISSKNAWAVGSKLNTKYTYGQSGGYEIGRLTKSEITGNVAKTNSYSYDEKGNLKTISGEREYAYDSYNRLKSEKDLKSNTTINYTYDMYNNLLSAGNEKYGYTNGRLSSFTKAGKTYAFEYDNMGNPVKYKHYGEKTAPEYRYNGNKLYFILDYPRIISYTYNADGIRTCKQVVTAQYGDTEETRQYVEGDRVIYEEDVFYKGPEGPSTAVIQNKRYYMYDQTGIAGMKINNTSYIFEKNVLGDVVAIYDAMGKVKARYNYDAWGNFEITEQDWEKIGDLNPFRYRGYYYDTETGFYYLQSRYYDPEIRRFINADNLELLPELAQVPGQLNLYAYCNNNPIMYTDPSGEGIFAILSIILGLTAATGLGLSIAGAVTEDHTMTGVGLAMVGIPALFSGGMAIWAGIGGATLTGIVGGVTALAGAGTGLFASAEIQQAISGNNWILDSGMSRSLYYGLMFSTATIATLGTFASLFCYGFNIKSIDKIGKLIPSNHPNGGYLGIRFKNARGALRSLELQNHVPHGLHFQLNSWNPKYMSVKTIRRWTWFLTRM